MRHKFEQFREFRGQEGHRGECGQSGFHEGFGEGFGHGFRGRGGFGGFGRGGGFRGRRGGPERMFGAGDLRYVILQLISERASHGYEIIKSIEERLGGAYAPSPGVVYPMLTMLEEMGWASSEMEGTRKLYSITEQGAKALQENKAAVDALFSRIEHMREHFSRQRPQQVERAIENLRMALRMKLGSLTTEQIHEVTDILDEATKKIERIG